LPTGQTVDLVELVHVARVHRLRAVHAPREHQPQRRLALLHGAHPARRGVRAQHDVGIHEVGVVRIARRMIGREVELAEVVRVEFDLGARVDREAEPVEQVEQLVTDLRQHVRPTGERTATRQRHVEGVRILGGTGERLATRAFARLDQLLAQIERATEHALLLDRQ
jgi:hypothetical protein